ncbi:MAG: hypothetical protein P4L61_00610 [Candidatus Pacebacteria bacterium]|nr:hypothetical protein [Candidatus Paceibacterota bacterium]
MEVITMKAEAWGAQRHESDHILAEGADFSLADLAADGSVSITFKTNRPFGVNGEYNVRLTFTAAEMDKMQRQSLAGTAKGLIQPAPKGAKKSELKRRI